MAAAQAVRHGPAVRWRGVRRWRERTAAARTSGGGGVEWRRVGGAARGVTGGTRCGGGGLETRRKRAEVKPTARAREIYDMWAPRFSLTPVNPTLRF